MGVLACRKECLYEKLAKESENNMYDACNLDLDVSLCGVCVCIHGYVYMFICVEAQG